MRHEMLINSACPFLQYKKGTLSQQFVTHVAPPLDKRPKVSSKPGLYDRKYGGWSVMVGGVDN